jgi:hypothetical protein
MDFLPCFFVRRKCIDGAAARETASRRWALVPGGTVDSTAALHLANLIAF